MKQLAFAMEAQWPIRWEVDTWVCSMGEECCFVKPQWLGHSSDGGSHTPFVAVFKDGTCGLVCEDCAGLLEEETFKEEARHGYLPE